MGHGDVLHSERLQAVVAFGREQVNRAMLVEDSRIAELGEQGEHGSVAHMVAVEDVHLVGEVAGVLARKHDGAELGAEGALAQAEVVVQVVLRVAIFVSHRVVDDGAGHVHPRDDVRVYRAQGVPIDHQIGQVGHLPIFRHLDGAAGNLLVLVLALPIGVEQVAQRSHRADEHDERKPEHDAPEAPALLLFLLGIGILCGSHEASPFDIDLST